MSCNRDLDASALPSSQRIAAIRWFVVGESATYSEDAHSDRRASIKTLIDRRLRASRDNSLITQNPEHFWLTTKPG
jgi:hypothetical protein